MHRRHPHPFTSRQGEAVAVALPEWARLDARERTRLEHIAAGLLETVSWEASRGFDLTDDIRTAIAAGAALLGLGLDDPVFPNVHAVVVHPGTITLRGPRPGRIPRTVDDFPAPVYGHTTAHGPVFIAWDTARRQAQHPEEGRNVVLHEFAHKLDAQDGTLNGTPLLADSEQRRRWVEVCEREYRSLQHGRGSPLIDAYAATNPSEFFAVVTELFFARGADLADELPELYQAFARFYRQDPAARAHNPTARST
jgi:Mlc titration factor MtfA (ptsG expression regulator)